MDGRSVISVVSEVAHLATSLLQFCLLPSAASPAFMAGLTFDQEKELPLLLAQQEQKYALEI